MAVRRSTDPFLRDKQGNPIGSRNLTPEEIAANKGPVPDFVPHTDRQPISQTPADIQAQQDAGNEFIRAREKARALGASRMEAAQIAAGQLEGQSFRQVTTPQAQQNTQNQNAAISQIGNVPAVPPAPPQPLFTDSVAGQGLSQVGVGTAAGLIGATVASGGIALPIIAAGIGADVLTNLVSAKREETLQNIKNDYVNVKLAASDMERIIKLANIPEDQGGLSPQKAVNAYNENLLKIMTAQADLKRITHGDLDSFLSKGDRGMDELIRINSFLDGGSRILVEQQLADAIRKKAVEPLNIAASFPEENTGAQQ